MDKLRQLDEAVRSRTTVHATAPRSAGSAPGGVPLSREDALSQMAALQQQADAQGRDNPAAAYLARLQQLQAASLGDTAARPVPPAEPAVGGKDYRQFDVQGQGDRWRLDSRAEAPRSPYELRAGFIVPAVLISGVNSDLPGQIVAQVSQDVFDTATGKWRLIPQGSRLVGQYSSDIAYGQSRVLVAWQRIVFPDGKAMDIGSMPGADSAGYAGFRDQVNNHYFRLFSSAFLMSGITAGIAMSQPQTLSLGTRQSASSAMSEALGQQLGQVTAQLIARNMNIAPTLEIRPGYRFNVIVTKDLTFSRPYKAFDY
jgi:type IV secretion system protein VirB10